MYTSLFFTAIVALARVASATPPSCLLSAIGQQADPSDMKTLCGAHEAWVAGNMTKECTGSSLAAAQSAFASTCLAAESVTISFSSSTSSASSSTKTGFATATSSGSKTSATSESSKTGSDSSSSESSSSGSSASATVSSGNAVATGSPSSTTSSGATASSTGTSGGSLTSPQTAMGALALVAGLVSYLL